LRFSVPSRQIAEQERSGIDANVSLDVDADPTGARHGLLRHRVAFPETGPLPGVPGSCVIAHPWEVLDLAAVGFASDADFDPFVRMQTAKQSTFIQRTNDSAHWPIAMQGRLNLFQRTMLRWRELYPYNAVHVVFLAGPLEVPRLQKAIDEALAVAGLTGYELDSRRRRFTFDAVEGRAEVRAELRILPAAGGTVAATAAEIERQLNAPFAGAGPMTPFRFFAIDDEPGFRLGLTYDHFIAGGDSIVVLLRAIADQYSGRNDPRQVRPSLRRYPRTYTRLFLRHARAAIRGLWHLPRATRSLRRAVRPRYADVRDARNAFTHFCIPPEQFAQIMRTAKSWGVTVNDLWLALLLHALAPLVPAERHAARRRDLAVASIINIREDIEAGAQTTFGQFLSSFRVAHPVPDGISLWELARDIHAETARVKRDRLYFQTLLALGMVGMVWRFLPTERRERFHSKSYAILAGLTLLNVTALWPGADTQAPPLQYLRGVSTGPLAPLVLAISTVGNTLIAGVSYRTAAFDRATIARLVSNLLHSVETLA